MQAMAGGGEGGAIEPGLADTLLRETAAAPSAGGHRPAAGAAGARATALAAVALPAPQRAQPQGRSSNSEVPETRLIRVSAMIAATLLSLAARKCTHSAVRGIAP
jgi:flagellar biosynthesis protein FlhA